MSVAIGDTLVIMLLGMGDWNGMKDAKEHVGDRVSWRYT